MAPAVFPFQKGGGRPKGLCGKPKPRGPLGVGGLRNAASYMKQQHRTGPPGVAEKPVFTLAAFDSSGWVTTHLSQAFRKFQTRGKWGASHLCDGSAPGMQLAHRRTCGLQARLTPGRKGTPVTRPWGGPRSVQVPLLPACCCPQPAGLALKGSKQNAM